MGIVHATEASINNGLQLQAFISSIFGQESQGGAPGHLQQLEVKVFLPWVQSSVYTPAGGPARGQPLRGPEEGQFISSVFGHDSQGGAPGQLQQLEVRVHLPWVLSSGGTPAGIP